MYSLTIHFGPNAMVWSLLFKEKERAESIFKNLSDSVQKQTPLGGLLADDFGQEAYIETKSIHGVMLEDLDLTEEARIQRSLMNARGEVKARQRASTDPIIRTAAQGPSVLQPRFNG
jgi:hypothetical protein